MNQIEAYCKANKITLTVKRKQILFGLVQSKKAISAYEIIDFCKDNYGETIPPMSIYRILNFLEEKLLVHKLNSINKYIACEHIHCDHEHNSNHFLICDQCNKVKEVNIQGSEASNFQVSIAELGFKLINPQLEMHCICEECLNQEGDTI